MAKAPVEKKFELRLGNQLRDQVEELQSEIEKLKTENEMYRNELMYIKEREENQMDSSFSSNFESAILDENASDNNKDGDESALQEDANLLTLIKGSSLFHPPGRKRKILNKVRRNLIPLAATMGWAFAQGKGLGVAAKIGAAIAGGVAGLVAKTVPVIQSDIGEMTIRWAPIGLLDMYNPGGAVTYVEPRMESKQSGKANSVFYAQGEGRFGVYCSRRPFKVMLDDAEVQTTYEVETGLLEFQLTETERFSEKVLDELERLVVLDERRISLKW